MHDILFKPKLKFKKPIIESNFIKEAVEKVKKKGLKTSGVDHHSNKPSLE
jgi:hypothetical protein